AVVLVEQLEEGLDRAVAGLGDLRVIAPNHPLVFQAVDAFADRRARQVDHAGDLADGSARVGTQDGDYLAVELVHGVSRQLAINSVVLPGNGDALIAVDARGSAYHNGIVAPPPPGQELRTEPDTP